MAKIFASDLQVAEDPLVVQLAAQCCLRLPESWVCPDRLSLIAPPQIPDKLIYWLLVGSITA
jgi:hypothetical protein